jgi:L-amino acid N-acyltransferase YncA
LDASVTQVRPARESDAPSVCEVLNKVIAEGDAFLFEAPFAVDEVRAWMQREPACFVEEADAEIVGVYFLHANSPGRGAHVANAIYAVRPDARSQGVGTRLGEHSLETARRLGFRSIQFNAVVATNRGALKLWKKLGFSVVGRIPKAFRNSADTYVDLHILHRFL